MLTLRSAAILVTAGAAAAVLAGCASNAPAASAPGSSTPTASQTYPGVSAATSPPATPSTAAPATSSTPAAPAPASAPAATASAPARTSPAARCATATGALPHSSIAVCPATGPVGSVVHVTIKDCAPVGAGLPDMPAAGLFFLGPKSWLGTNGGGGTAPYSPRTGSEATATFTIPATYTGGNEHGPYPTLKVTPGTGYEFVTDPAGECHVSFTVTAS